MQAIGSARATAPTMMDQRSSQPREFTLADNAITTIVMLYNIYRLCGKGPCEQGRDGLFVRKLARRCSEQGVQWHARGVDAGRETCCALSRVESTHLVVQGRETRWGRTIAWRISPKYPCTVWTQAMIIGASKES